MAETVDLYKAFRKELDNICIPEILDNLECCEMIYSDGKCIGMVCGNIDYIDCVYVLPEYRRQGHARYMVTSWYKRYKNPAVPVRLHIINKNQVALDFWNSIFDLIPIERNCIDTLYEIKCLKPRWGNCK